MLCGLLVAVLEVGNLANGTEDRSHFGMWSIMSSPLILSFNLTDPVRMDRAWPIISNRRVLAVNQRWAGSAGRRLSLATTADGGGWQAWAKPMGGTSYAVFLVNTGETPVHAKVSLRNVSATAFSSPNQTCVRDLYTGQMLAPPPPGAAGGGTLAATLPVHDSGFYCAWPSTAHGSCDGSHDCP